MQLLDIRQGRNGDCFILSSIISILHSLSSDYIKYIIKEINSSIYSFSFWNKNKKYSIQLNSNHIGQSLSPKSKLWVKRIEYGYIYVYYQNDITNILEKGGMSHQVLNRLTGLNIKVHLNKVLDNYNEEQYSVLCDIINHINWNTSTIINDTITKWIDSIYLFIY